MKIIENMSGTLRLALMLSALVVLAFTGCGGKDARGDDAGAIEQAADTGDRSITAFGTVVAVERQEVRLPWSGRIVDIPVWEGQRVEKDDVLAVLDSGDLDAAVEAARLDAESARGSAEEAGSRLASLDVALAEASDRLDRNRKLMESGSVSAQELYALQAEYDGLVHDRSAASWALKSRENDADRAETVYRRLIERGSEEQILDNALICPFESAVVAEVSVRQGTEAEAGQLVVVLHDEGSLVVEADLSEEFVRDIEEGASATIIPIADPERSYAGTVLELAGLARLVNGENTVKTRISIDERDGFLREGFNVDVEIHPGS